ncbi:MAG: hypothetical protein WB555_21670 [Candidatus Korobacteraceae bacterium]
MFCKACGQGIDRGDKFCRNCGVNLPQEPIESAVAASAAAAPTGEPPMPVAFSTAELQRPLPIPKALLTEVASAAAVEEKPSPPATTTAAAAPPPISDAGKTAASDRDRPRGDAPAPVLEPKPEAAAATEKPAEAKSGGVESAPQKTAEAKPEATSTPAQPASEKPVQSSESPAPPAPIPLAPSSMSSVEREPEKPPQPSDVPAQKPSPVSAAAIDLQPASAPKPQAAQPAIPEKQAQAAVSTSVATMQETAKPDTAAREAGARPVRLCPECHRLVGEDDKFCERCRARLDQPAAPEPTPVSERHLGVPSFAGYATETPASKDVEKTSGRPAVSDPSGIDDLANLRIRKRRLPIVEILVSVILLGGAAMAVWMLRSTLPDKAATPAAAIDVTISPARAKVAAGHGVDFAATVTGTDNYNVDWVIEEGDNGGRIVSRGAKAKTGAVSSLAVYMSPKTPGTYHLTATSKADPGKSASATITVTGK